MIMREEKTMENLQTNGMDNLCDYKRRIQELEAELDKTHESEANMYDSLVMQTKQLEKKNILLQQSEVEISSLKQKLEAFSAKDDSKVTELLQEIEILKSELKLATDAEEKSHKAMDDLALALKEVATEANELKEKLALCQKELEKSKHETEGVRTMLKKTETNYREYIEETVKEAGRYKNIAERLRLEAEESLQAWIGKETEFVNCIKRVELERSASQKEVSKLHESIREEENKTRERKEEIQKLRGILKQALNEASVAKEAAVIARAENYHLQECLAQKEESLNLLSLENEMLKIHEAAAFENIKELNRLLAEASAAKESKNS